MQNDSFRAYLAQQYVVDPASLDAVDWNLVVWRGYLEWCRHTGNHPYPADPYSPEVQTLITKMGALFRIQDGGLFLVHIRLRSFADPPFRSVFQVRVIGQENDDSEGI